MNDFQVHWWWSIALVKVAYIVQQFLVRCICCLLTSQSCRLCVKKLTRVLDIAGFLNLLLPCHGMVESVVNVCYTFGFAKGYLILFRVNRLQVGKLYVASLVIRASYLLNLDLILMLPFCNLTWNSSGKDATYVYLYEICLFCIGYFLLLNGSILEKLLN